MVAKVNKSNTGGGEGVILMKREDFENRSDLFENIPNTSGTYYYKVYKLASKLPWWTKKIVPRDKVEIHHEIWNAFPYMKSFMHNDPILSKERFFVKVETFYASDRGEQENVFKLTPELLKERHVVRTDFAYDHLNPKDYKLEEDPTKFLSKKTGRGMLPRDWKETTTPHMCVYKLITISARIFGLQRKLENIAHDVFGFF